MVWGMAGILMRTTLYFVPASGFIIPNKGRTASETSSIGGRLRAIGGHQRVIAGRQRVKSTHAEERMILIGVAPLTFKT